MHEIDDEGKINIDESQEKEFVKTMPNSLAQIILFHDSIIQHECCIFLVKLLSNTHINELFNILKCEKNKKLKLYIIINSKRHKHKHVFCRRIEAIRRVRVYPKYQESK